MSNWFSIQSCDQKDDGNEDDDKNYQLVNLMEGMTKTTISQANYLAECKANVMAIELSDGSYARVKIWERNLFDGIFQNINGKENKSKIEKLGG